MHIHRFLPVWGLGLATTFVCGAASANVMRSFALQDVGFAHVAQMVDPTAMTLLADQPQELTLETYQVGQNITSLLFEYVDQFGEYDFTFGFVNLANITADPTKQRSLWRQQAMQNAVVVFDERVNQPGDTLEVDVTPGDEIAFFILPDNTLAEWLDNPNLRAPLFSYSPANPGGYDQVHTFDEGDSLLLMMFEDQTRLNGHSDEDYNDVIVRITPLDSTRNPAPEPATAAMLALGALAIGRRRR